MAAIAKVTAEILDSQDLINVIVRVVDEDGVEGIGESWWGIADASEPARAGRPMASVVNDLLAPRLVGHEANDIDAIWEDTVRWGLRYGDQGLFMMGVSGVDLALWDLQGKRADRSVCELLGGPIHESLLAYASLPWLRSTDKVLHETTRALDAGFTAVKLHETDPTITAAIRSEFGDGLIVMVDVNGHFDIPGAKKHARRLSDLGVLWFEEPVSPMRDHSALAEVERSADIAIAAGENEYTLDDFERLLRTANIAHVQPELTKIGGLTPARAIGDLIASHGRSLSPHNFRLGPSCAASIHWAFSSHAAGWVELPFFPEGQKFSHPMTLPTVVDGCIGPPNGPGFGLGGL